MSDPIAGRLDNGRVKSVNVSQDGHLEVEVHGPLSAFGEVDTVSQVPVFQMDFAYNNVNTDLALTNAYGGGGVTAANQMVSVSTGAQTSSLASFRPRRIMRYRPGQGALIRFTGMFDTATTGNSQLIGFSSGESGLFFGSIDNVRGVHRTYGGKREIQTLTIAVGSSNAQTAVVTLGGVAFNVPITVTSGVTTDTAFEISKFDFSTSAPGWTCSAVGATVKFVCLVAGDQTGNFTISFPTSGSGSFAETVAGVANSIETIAQANWNVDICDGRATDANPSNINLDWTKLNVFYIKWQYLGAGVIEFGLEQAETGELVPVHRINYPNTSTTTSLTQPGGFFSISCRNTTNNTALTVKSASLAGFVEGHIRRLGVQRSTSTTKASVGTSFVPLISLRNGHVFQNRVSMGEFYILGMSVSNNSSTRSIEVRLNEQAVLGNTANYAALSSGISMAEIDTSATTYANGSEKFSIVVGPNGTAFIPLEDHILTLEGNNWLTCIGKTLSGTADISIGLHWVEDH